MPQVNITLTIGRGFAWQFGNQDWNDDRRAAIFRQFWDKVQRADAKACWPWTGSIASHGYGVFSVGDARIRAHRFAWIASRGPIPEGQEVCHQCDCKSCVNPDHLFLGSHRDNMLDAIRKGRKRAWGLQKLDAARVLDIRSRAASGVLQRSIATEFGISEGTVSQIVNRRTWAHLHCETECASRADSSAT